MKTYTLPLLALSTLFALTALFMFSALYRMDHAASLEMSTRTAAVLVDAVNLSRTSYSQKNIRKIRPLDGIQIGPEHHQSPNMVPNPATFAIELADTLTKNQEGLKVRMYSNHPFPNRKESGGPRTRFETEALAALKKTPDEPYIQQQSTQQGKILSYAEAIIMKESCVVCHNDLPNSPKKDWKIGDVRGAMSISLPIDYGATNEFRDTVRVANIAFSSLVLMGLFALALIYYRSQRYSTDVAKQVSKRTESLHEMAHSDPLTKVGNRRYFEEQLSRLIQQARNNNQALCLIYYDLDHFKAINDEQGHSIGDACLELSTASVKNCLRPEDCFARIGGEEFAVILPQIDRAGAEDIAERIRRAVAETEIPGTPNHMSTSVGIAYCLPGTPISKDNFMELADKALYQAKTEGRNRVVSIKVSDIQAP